LRNARSPAIGNESSRAVAGSGVLLVATSPLRVIVPVADRVWTEALPLQVSAKVPVNAPAVPRTPVALIFSVNDEVRLKTDSPVRANPLRFWACVKVPVTVLPLPVRLPEGTVNDTSRPFRLAMFERLAQPVPEHAAEAVVKVPPVSTPEVVMPRSKFPPDRLTVI